jgi:hypothetical protein
MTEREQLLADIAQAMRISTDELTLPPSLWNILAEAALEVIELPLSTSKQEILNCTCGHTGYGSHMIGCLLYGNS